MGIIALCLFAVALAAPQARDEDVYAEILRSDFEQDEVTGAFRHALETSNGINQEVQGEPEPLEGAIIMRGYYFLPSDDGSLVRVDWVADQDGFRAESPIILALPQFVLDQIAFAAANP